MINFRLKKIDEIEPVGQDDSKYLSWFWLTDGDLWLEFGKETIYEYSDEAMKHFGDKPTKYNDYQISRFIEDFSYLFKVVGESVPSKFYELTSNLNGFLSDSQNWLVENDTDDDEYSDFYFDSYDVLISWISQRLLDSSHLLGGPKLYFFRHEEKIRIVWITDYQLENGISLWTAKNGQLEISYEEFVSKIKDFWFKFLEEMMTQVRLAREKDWSGVNVDKERLLQEHRERIVDFFEKLKYLEYGTDYKTDWSKIEEQLTNMIGKK